MGSTLRDWALRCTTAFFIFCYHGCDKWPQNINLTLDQKHRIVNIVYAIHLPYVRRGEISEEIAKSPTAEADLQHWENLARNLAFYCKDACQEMRTRDEVFQDVRFIEYAKSNKHNKDTIENIQKIISHPHWRDDLLMRAEENHDPVALVQLTYQGGGYNDAAEEVLRSMRPEEAEKFVPLITDSNVNSLDAAAAINVLCRYFPNEHTNDEIKKQLKQVTDLDRQTQLTKEYKDLVSEHPGACRIQHSY